MIAEFISLAVIYFAVIDPIGSIPIFLSITENLHHKPKQWIALRGSFVAFCVLIFFGLFGSFILSHLKISADTFNIAGGAILFVIALEMVNGRRQARKSRVAAESVPKEELIRLSSSPLAVPLLAGPAAITSVMVFGDFYDADLIGFKCWLNIFCRAAIRIDTLHGCLGIKIYKLDHFYRHVTSRGHSFGSYCYPNHIQWFKQSRYN